MKKLMVNHYHWSITMEMARLSERIAYALHLSCVTAHQTGFSNLFKNYFNQNWIKRNWSNNGREINFYYKNNIFGSPASDCVAVLRARARRYFRLFWAGTVHAWGNLPQKQEGGGGPGPFRLQRIPRILWKRLWQDSRPIGICNY